MSKSIWVICSEVEYNERYIFQLVSKAHELLDGEEGDVSVVCIGKRDNVFFERLHDFGTNRIIFAEVSSPSESLCTNIVSELIKTHDPFLLLLPATRYSKIVAARLSNQFNVGLTADCIDIKKEDGQFVYVRAAINDAIIASIKCVRSTFEICTIKDNVFESKEIQRKELLEEEMFEVDSSLTKVVDMQEIIETKPKEASSLAKILSAKVVFGVGRGVSERGFELLQQAAKKFGAEIVCTRNVVENGTLPRTRQVGQSGIIIAPNIYVCFGISGACQHIVGIKNAKLIIAVNTDKDAPIFQYADYAIVEDANKLIELLCEM